MKDLQNAIAEIKHVTHTNSCGPPLPSSGTGITFQFGPSVAPAVDLDATAARAILAASVRPIENISARSRAATAQMHAPTASTPMTSHALLSLVLSP